MTEKPRFGPHPALLPVLLAMSQNHDNIEETLDGLVQLIQSTKNAILSMKNGMETFQTGLMNIAYQPAGQGGPLPQNKPDISTLPAEEKEKKASTQSQS